ncbi:MAG: hypothetical protein WCE90_03350 [Candidatus Zixiibacteriota bacterium]
MTNHKTSTYLLMEKVTFVYMLVLSLLILVFHANLTNDLTGSPYHWATYTGHNLGVCLVIMFFANGLNHNTNRWILFSRHFHYVSEVAAGLLVGGVSIFICDRATRKRKADGMRVAVKKEFSLDLARVD